VNDPDTGAVVRLLGAAVDVATGSIAVSRFQEIADAELIAAYAQGRADELEAQADQYQREQIASAQSEADFAANVKEYSQ
jgi:hypothetical protein